MKWKKSPLELIEYFDKILPNNEFIQRKKMFGYPCAFANKKLFIGLHEDNLILKLAEADRQKFIEKYKANIFSPMPGRVMKEYVVVPKTLYEKKAEMKKWIDKSLTYVLSL